MKAPIVAYSLLFLIGSCLGQSTTARSFNGTTDQLTNAQNYFNSGTVRPFTVAFWFKSLDTAQTNRQVVVWNNYLQIRYGRTSSGGFSQLEFSDFSFFGTDPKVGSQITITDTNWHHIAYRYGGTGGAYVMFVDGVKTVINAACNIALGAGTGNTQVGGFPNSEVLHGSLARLIFSNTTAFTDAQILALATSGAATGISGVTGYWLLDGNNSPEPESAPSPNANSLTVTGTTQVAGPTLAQAIPSTQGKWSTQSTTIPINPVHAALMRNGKVLIVAGSGNCPPYQSGCPAGPPYSASNSSGAGVYDPVAGTFTQLTLSWDMFCNGMVVLPDGRPFINSGTLQYDPFSGSLKSSVFDPSTNAFTDVQNMAHGRWYPTLTTLGDGRVMTFSGLNETGSTNTTVEIYTVGSGWSTPVDGGWTPPLYPHMHLLPNGKVFYSGPQGSAALFDPSNSTWTLNVANHTYGVTRLYGSAVLLPLTPANNYDPRVIVMGGGNPSTATTETIDLGAPTPAWNWGPNMSQPRIEMNAVILPTGKILALGGSYNDEDDTTASLNADLYDPATNSFSSAGANAYARLYHSVALLLPDATVWLAGGNPHRGAYEQHMEVYQPAYLFTDSNGNIVPATRPSIGSSPSNITYGSSFTVQTLDAASISSVVLVRNGSVTHAFDMDQRLVGLSFTAGSGAMTVTAPPNGNIAPPGYYMLFLVNGSGVPSVANFVQLGQYPDFSVSATPSAQTVVQGTSTSYTVTVAPSGGFTGMVSLSVSGLPQGAQASFTPSSITTSGSSTLSISTLISTPSGSYPLTITATSGSLVHTANVTLVVSAPSDFAISVNPLSQTVSRSSSTQYTVTISAQGASSGTVNLSVSGLPQRTTSSFTPTAVTGSGNSTLIVSANKKAATGTYTLTITGKSGSLVRSATVSLTIQ